MFTIYAESFLLDDALFALEQALTIEPELKETARDEQSFHSLMDLTLFKYMIQV